MSDDSALFVGRMGHTDSDELMAFVKRLQQDDPLRPVTVVCPHRYAMQSLRHRLGLAGFANVQFKEFAMLAEFLGAPHLAERGRRPLTAIFRNAVVGAVASEADGMLKAQRNHSSTHRSLRHTFRELRHTTDDTLDRLSEQGGLRSEVVALYRRFRERTTDFYDDEDLAEAAADAVRNGRASGLTDLGFIVFFRVRRLIPAQGALVQALAEHKQCAVLLGTTGDASDCEADESTLALKDILKDTLGEPQMLPIADTHAPAANNGAYGKSVHLLRAPDAHQEVRWIIRRIVRRAEADDTPFHRMAILYRQHEPYGTLIRQELDLAGIPAAGADDTWLADTAAGRTIIGILDMSDSNMARDAVMAWLTGCPLKPQGVNDASFNPSLWDTISKRAGVVSGIEHWRQRLSQYAQGMQERADTGTAQDDMSEAQAYRLRFEADAAQSLLRFIDRLAANIVPPDGSSWSAYSDWAKELLNLYLTDYLPDDERRAAEKIEGIVEELKSADEIEQNASLEVFRRSLLEALEQQPVGRSDPVGHGVFVAPLKCAAAMNFDAVHIVGMVAGAIPPVVRDDPLLPEQERERVGGAVVGLPMHDQHKADERYDFLAALATAPACTLSYALADLAGQRRNFASPWLLEVASELHGSQVSDSDLFNMSDEPWLTVITSMWNALDTVHTTAYADTHDYNLERLQEWANAGKKVIKHPLTSEDRLAVSMRLGRMRNGERLTEWDGNLSSIAENAAFTSGFGKQALSSTSLERWARCPFSYFLGRVLRLSAEEIPEDIYTITPLEKGLLIHNILKDFVTQLGERNELPPPTEIWSDAHRNELHRIAKEAFADASRRGVVGKPIMWRIATEDMLMDLDSFLNADFQLRQKSEMMPRHTEARFGMSGAGDEWKNAVHSLPDESEILFRGVIDRIDISEDGTKALVLDYKTGGSGSYKNLAKDPIDGGKHLQLAIYSLAVKQALAGASSVAAAYWFISSAGKFAVLPSKYIDINDEQVEKRFGEGMSIIVDGIHNGLFPANPGKGEPNSYDSNCRYCDFTSLCPSRRDTLWKRKKSDPQLEGYLKLVGDDDE